MKTKFKQPTEKEWQRLYELASKLKELAPWRWMDETMIFGVENPETREIGFVSPMGMLGEHLSVGVYLGAEGLYGFWDFQVEGAYAEPFALFEIPQLQVSFENREALEKQDRDTIKKLGLKFRGSKNYPLFRSIRPGFMPWFITSDEAKMLICAIEQTLEFAPHVRENPKILEDRSSEEIEIALVRFAEKQGAKIVWREEFREIPPPSEKEFTVKVPPAIIDEMKNFPQEKNFILEMDLFHAPTPVAERGKRPYIPKMLMLADGRSGMILNFKILPPHEDYAENYAEITRNLLESLGGLAARPQEILVVNEDLFDLLKGFTQQLNIKLRQADDLRAARAAKDGLFGFFGGGMF